MEATMVVTLINGLMQTAKNLHNAYTEINGPDSIPSWESITANNDRLQDKIDAEKDGGK